MADPRPVDAGPADLAGARRYPGGRTRVAALKTPSARPQVKRDVAGA
jgi:hypothetical protein